MPTRRKTATPRSQGVSNSDKVLAGSAPSTGEDLFKVCDESTKKTIITEDSLNVEEETSKELPYNSSNLETKNPSTSLNPPPTVCANESNKRLNLSPKALKKPRNVTRFSPSKGV